MMLRHVVLPEHKFVTQHAFVLCYINVKKLFIYKCYRLRHTLNTAKSELCI